MTQPLLRIRSTSGYEAFSWVEKVWNKTQEGLKEDSGRKNKHDGGTAEIRYVILRMWEGYHFFFPSNTQQFRARQGEGRAELRTGHGPAANRQV